MEDHSEYFENLIGNKSEKEDINIIKAENDFYRYELDSKNRLIDNYIVQLSDIADKNIALENQNKSLRFWKYYAIAFTIVTIVSGLFEIIFK